MHNIRKFSLLLREIGLPSLTAYAAYAIQKRLGLFNSGSLTRNKEFSRRFITNQLVQPIHLTFTGTSADGITPLGSTDDISKGLYKPFCGEDAKLEFTLQQPLKVWTAYSDLVDGVDIKKYWEPARFCWSLSLARTYECTKNEEALRAFWGYFHQFISVNPPYFGPNWVSAQEVALRAINWLIILPSLRSAAGTLTEDMDELIASLWQHFLRLIPTISYAKSQNNNHLLSEALGLTLLGSFFAPQSALADKWKERAQSLFERTLLHQVAEDGTYSQHSANYHRMFLHLALIYHAALQQTHQQLSPMVKEKLAKATLWLQGIMDPVTGQAANLGHNDGTLLLPFGCDEYSDYRPTLQAASLAFLGCPALPAGPWDALSIILGLQPSPQAEQQLTSVLPGANRIGNKALWASLRAVHFHSRPAHADQLHAEIWYSGHNIAVDAGTYAYNDPPPWQNPLMATRIHNTITVDSLDQMQRAGKFLWLDWAQASFLPSPTQKSICASHNGYRSQGVHHQRTLTLQDESTFVVEDLIQNKKPSVSHLVSLHWHLPDWDWAQADGGLVIRNQNQKVLLSIACLSHGDGKPLSPADLSLIRAGKPLLGSTSDEVMGWVSATYGVKVPALAYTISWSSHETLLITSTWQFTKVK